MAANATPQPEPERQIFTFASRAEFEAWARANVPNPDEFVQGTYESMERWRAWRAAGNTGLPPGYKRFSDYRREHPL
ncbi:MAG TPA: hypothetical protein VFE37_09275 [Chloroflexota bacterium]|nr:hypothetical protein [Chloroflexota bacterium]